MSSLASFFSAEFIHAFAWTLFHSVWQGGLIALVTAGLIFLLRRYSPSIRYTVFCIMLLMIPVAFSATFAIYYNQSGQEAPGNALSANPVYPAKDQGIQNDMAASAIEHGVNGWFTFPSDLIDSRADLFVMIWFVGFLFFLFRFAGSIIYVYRLKNKHLYVVEKEWEHKLEDLSMQLGIKKAVKIAESALARIPMTIGYLKPVILLPVGTLSGVPLQQIDAILLHELAHILRKDYLVNILQSVIEMLFFYHPATWWISSLIRQEREHICDDIAISVNNDQINYIKALTTMEEMNSKSPVLANAMGGSQKKLLARVKRLVSPVRLRKGLSESILAILVILGLIFVFSFNAMSDIPSSFDLTGRESGERVFNFIPYTHSAELTDNSMQPAAGAPDSIVSTSKSGKVIVKVYADSINPGDEKHLQVFVNDLDHNMNSPEKGQREMRKEVIIVGNGSGDADTLNKVIVVKTGDSLKIIQNDTILYLSGDNDTTLTLSEPFGWYGFATPEIPEFPELQEMPDMRLYYFDEDQKRAQEEFERQLKDQQFDMQEFERQQRDMEREMEKNHLYLENPEGITHEWRWEQKTPEPEISQGEKIIRQELRDDGLTERGRKYVIEVDSKAMYINGEKQPKEIYKKYKKLVESLNQASFESGDTFKMIF